MKRYLILILTIIFTSTWVVQSQARDKAVDGLLIGAGGGALLGQAFGGDTEATLIGGAVGGALGYIIGKEHVKDRHPPQHDGFYHYKRDHNNHGYGNRHHKYHGNQRHSNHYYHRSKYNDRHRWHKRKNVRHCKQTEHTITKHGRSKTIIKKVCTDNPHHHTKKSKRRKNRHNEDDYYGNYKSGDNYFIRY